jgi:hypothetical protein
VHFETKDLRLMSSLRLLRDQRRIDLEENVVERRAKVCPVDGGVAGGLRVVDVFALGAVELDRLESGEVGEAEWE